jgi:hypothetical protein
MSRAADRCSWLDRFRLRHGLPTSGFHPGSSRHGHGKRRSRNRTSRSSSSLAHITAYSPSALRLAATHAKATKRAWRNKTSKNVEEASQPPRPGDVISVDQLVSPTPGLVAQMTGTLTTKRYRYATIYVDQATGLSYVYLQKTSTAEETIEGKAAFEKYAESRGISIHAYHADNGIFRAHKWVLACRERGQSLTFAGVNAHRQNGVAERRIRSLQELTRTMLIHSNRRWPKAVTANLWPYAMRMANEIINNSPSLKDKERRTPYQIFSSTSVNINIKHWKPFGCPVYVLEGDLQTGKPHHKWAERSRVGIYLGQSPQHAQSVALVLSRVTALVSPQCHVKFDESFHTVRQDNLDSTWQSKAGFLTQREPKNTILPQQVALTTKRKRQPPLPQPEVDISEMDQRAHKRKEILLAPNTQMDPQREEVRTKAFVLTSST